jgi:8-oxo-dGTP diphosphatase
MTYRNPLVTVDLIIECSGGIVLIKRRNPPLGWALPGGFVDYGETLEDAAIREALEETGLRVALIEQLHTYSDPSRDPRHHSVTTVFIAAAHGEPVGADDAARAIVIPVENPPSPLVFDHAAILKDYLRYKRGASKRSIFGYDGAGNSRP